MVVGKRNDDTIVMREFIATHKETGEQKKACRFYVNDDMRPNTVSIFGNMYPVYKMIGRYYITVGKKIHYNECVFIAPFDTPLSKEGFDSIYTINS